MRAESWIIDPFDGRVTKRRAKVDVHHSTTRIAASLRGLRSDPPRLVGRDAVSNELRSLVQAGKSVFVSGPAGVGKSSLAQALYAGWSMGEGSVPLLYCAESSTPRGVSVHLLVNLFLERQRLRGQYVERTTTIASALELRRFVECEPLPELRRLMNQSLAAQRACIVLDHLDDPRPRVASLLEVWLETMPVVVVARSPERTGRARGLLCLFERLEVEPLSESTLVGMARDLHGASGEIDLSEEDLHFAARRCEGNPGRLTSVLRAAAKHFDQRAGRVRWKLADLDLRIEAIEQHARRTLGAAARDGGKANDRGTRPLTARRRSA